MGLGLGWVLVAWMVWIGQVSAVWNDNLCRGWIGGLLLHLFDVVLLSGVGGVSIVYLFPDPYPSLVQRF